MTFLNSLQNTNMNFWLGMNTNSLQAGLPGGINSGFNLGGADNGFFMQPSIFSGIFDFNNFSAFNMPMYNNMSLPTFSSISSTTKSGVSTNNSTETKIDKGGKTKWDKYILKYCKEYNVDPDLVRAIRKAETGHLDNSTKMPAEKAKSRCGAMGLMQLMPATARSYGVTNAYDPE